MSRPMNAQERAEMRRKAKRTRQLSIDAGQWLHHNDQDIARLYEKQGQQCLYCQQLLAPGFHADHFIPISKGGVDTADNIALCCPSCNKSKWDQWPWEWDQWQGQFPVEWDWNWLAPSPRM